MTEFISKEPINKGWSGDKKYCVIHSEDAYTTVAQISDKSGVSPEKVQDCLESDLSQFILEKEGPESQFRFEGMYMNILPIISLFDFK